MISSAGLIRNFLCDLRAFVLRYFLYSLHLPRKYWFRVRRIRAKLAFIARKGKATLMKRLALYALLLIALACGFALAASPKAKVLKTPTREQIAAAKKAGKMQVRLETVKGTMLIELDGKAAPTTVANFVNLVKAGFYDGLPFHRVEPNFVIQAGDPTRVGRPKVDYTIPDESSPLKHDKGVIAMARVYVGGQMVPNSSSGQFYITLAATPHLDRLGFTVFGRVVKGLEVIDKIARDDKIKKATLVKK